MKHDKIRRAIRPADFFRFLGGAAPAQYRELVAGQLARRQRRILLFLLPSIVAIQVYNMISMAFLRPDGLSRFSHKVYFALYLVLATPTLLLFLSLLCARSSRRILRLAAGYGALLCLWGSAVNLYDLRVTENVSVYVFACVTVSVLTYLRPWQAAAIFGGNHLLFLLLFTTFQPEGVNNAGNYLNTTLIALASGVIAGYRYTSDRNAIVNRAVIDAQKDEISRVNEHLRRLVITDELTGLYNRRFLDDVLPIYWEKAMGTPVTVAMFDIDNFKQYNDTFGHQEGDRALRAVSIAIRGATDPSADYLLRFGGEEFAVFSLGADPAAARGRMRRVSEAVAALGIASPPGSSCPLLSVSGGVCTAVPAPGETPDVLLARADGALYRAKQAGRNRILFEPED